PTHLRPRPLSRIVLYRSRRPPPIARFPYPTLFRSVDYLLRGFERAFPAIRKFRPVRTTPGVRPTLFKWRRYEDERRPHAGGRAQDRKSTRLNSSHVARSYAVFCLKKTKISRIRTLP